MTGLGRLLWTFLNSVHSTPRPFTTGGILAYGGVDNILLRIVVLLKPGP